MAAKWPRSRATWPSFAALIALCALIGMGARADEVAHQAEVAATTTTVQWLPSCQLLASRVCAPTLLAVGVAAAEAAHAAAAAAGSEAGAREAALLALHDATSKTGRQLLAASLAALRCAAAHPSNASAVADCGRAAIAASPAAAYALVGAVGPSACAGLTSEPAACAAAPGCRLVPHGDHSDCEPAPSATAMYLTATLAANSTAVAGTAAREPTALAAAVQRLADSCAALLPHADEEEGASDSAAAAAATASLACGRAELLGAVVEVEALEALELVAEGEHHEEHEGHADEEAGHAEEEGHGHDHGSHVEVEVVHDDGDNAQNLRIASVFIVLTSAVLGCTLPWVMRGWAERRPLLGAALRCMSAGVILCLALVHVATHAIEEMNGLVGGGGGEGGGGHDGHGHRRMALSLHDYLQHPLAAGGGGGRHLLQDNAAVTAPAAAPAADPLQQQQQLPYAGDLAGLLGLLDLAAAAGHLHEEDEVVVVDEGNSAHKHPFPIGMCCVMFGFLLMAGAEMVVHAVIERRAEKAAAAAAERMYAAEKSKQAAMGGGGEAATGDLGAKGALPDVEAAAPQAALPQQATPQQPGKEAGDDASPDMRLEVVAVGGCGGSGQMQLPGPVVAVSTSARLAGLAALFELGCVFHSFIIGLSLGVLTQRGEVAAMLVALCIHQFAEGISLVSILMAAGLAGWRLAGMGLGYSLMAPAGIAVGIGISDSYDADSITARAVQGTINGVSGGVLLYLAAVMITTELSATATTASGMAAAAAGGGCCVAPPPRRWRGWERALLFAIVVASAAAFAVLAEWA